MLTTSYDGINAADGQRAGAWMLAPGQVIGGRYEVLGPLGQGGMAAVYRVRDQRLRREMALKLLEAAGEGEASPLFFFLREARAIAALNHPNIIKIYDFSGPDERPAFIVVDLIEGPNVGDLLRRDGRLDVAAAVTIAQGAAAAVAHAHEHGIIHRDIKPSNILVQRAGQVYLADFGLAKAYDDPAQLGQTAVGRKTTLFGTPEYMSPEQLLDQPAGPASDVFALGGVLYGMLTGVSPFLQAGTMETLAHIIDVDYLPLRERRSDAPDEVVALIDQCLQRDPAQRLPASTVAERCEAWLRANQITHPARRLARVVAGEPAYADLDGTAPGLAVAPSGASVAAPQQRPASAGSTTPQPAAAAAAPRKRPASDGPTGPLDGPGRGPSDAPAAPEAEATVIQPLAAGAAARASSSGEVSAREATPVIRSRGRRSASASASGGVEITAVQKASALRPARARWFVLLAGLALAAVLAGTYAFWQRQRAALPQVPSVVPLGVSAPGEGGAAQPQAATPPEGGSHEDGLRPSPLLVVGATRPDARPPAPPDGTAAESTSGPGGPTPPAPAGGPDPQGQGGAPGTALGAADGGERPESPAPGSPRAVVKPRGRTALVITVRPWGTVYVDGERYGNTPAVSTIFVGPGRHVVRVEHPSLGERSQTVQLRPGEQRQLGFDLRD